MLKDLALAALVGTEVVLLAEAAFVLSFRVMKNAWPHREAYIRNRYERRFERALREEASHESVSARREHPLIGKIFFPLPPDHSPNYGQPPRSKIVGLAEKCSPWGLAVLLFFVVAPACGLLVGAAVLGIDLPISLGYVLAALLLIAMVGISYLRTRYEERRGPSVARVRGIPPVASTYSTWFVLSAVTCLVGVEVLKALVPLLDILTPLINRHS
ncbi:hypothetical protein ACUIAJ_09005 [Dermabacteraceae bacterium CCM 9519]